MSEVAAPEIAHSLRAARSGQQLRPTQRDASQQCATQRDARAMLAALLCLTTTDADADALPRRKSTLKWAQDRELLFITVPLKRSRARAAPTRAARRRQAPPQV